MDAEIEIIRGAQKPVITAPTDTTPRESGFFHERVRPIFATQTNLCSGCHAETGANAM